MQRNINSLQTQLERTERKRKKKEKKRETGSDRESGKDTDMRHACKKYMIGERAAVT